MSSRICGNSNQPRAHSWELLIKKKKMKLLLWCFSKTRSKKMISVKKKSMEYFLKGKGKIFMWK